MINNARKMHYIEETITLVKMYKMAERYNDTFINKIPMDGSNVAESFEDSLRENLEAIHDEIMVEEGEISETLTPEQRTIQWASQQGGATNL